MPASFRRGRVSSVVERHEGLVRLSVDGRPCVAYPRLTGPVALGDEVVVNTQALDLGLGSGGFDVLAVNLTRGLALGPDPGAHVMKLPYTPLQAATVHAEEAGAGAKDLGGRPVVCCTLHSQLAPVCAGIGPALRVAYLQLEGGALPVSLSDALRELKRAGLIETSVAVGACVDGDVACVNIASALAWGASEEFDALVCAIGPGIVGTGAPRGHGAMAVVDALNTAAALGGRAILTPRISSADARERHRPVSHHTIAVLELALERPVVAWPAGLEPPDELGAVEEVAVDDWQEACADLPLDSMGRGPEDDPWFFAGAFAAGRLARGAG
jgi:hypothetical protein